MTKYRSIKLPDGLVKTIENFIDAHKRYGFNSIVDFVKDSVRKNLEKYQENQNTKNKAINKED